MSIHRCLDDELLQIFDHLCTYIHLLLKCVCLYVVSMKPETRITWGSIYSEIISEMAWERRLPFCWLNFSPCRWGTLTFRPERWRFVASSDRSRVRTLKLLRLMSLEEHSVRPIHTSHCSYTKNLEQGRVFWVIKPIFSSMMNIGKRER